MRKNIVVGMLIIAVAAALLGGATFALFTDTGTINDATFATGDVTLGDLTEVNIDISDMAPGDAVTKTFDVINDGSLNMYYRISFQEVSDDSSLASQLDVSVNGADAVKLSTLTGTGMFLIDKTSLASGETDSITLEFALPLETGNAYESATFSCDLLVEATQAKNNTTDTVWD